MTFTLCSGMEEKHDLLATDPPCGGGSWSDMGDYDEPNNITVVDPFCGRGGVSPSFTLDWLAGGELAS